ncbi:putative endoglucanase type F [Madurella mycetomatis]|uniref:Endoglucanase type F n=1 Tax=Madurella mycetomatis TaxID=100816 RepID=A0A175W758_9PEZI|nr:putative endoglucanase type F [Madurella mycetomatis]
MGQYLLKATALALLATAPRLAAAANEAGLWQQCGGIGYTESVTCVAGAACTAWNDWYHQCVPGETATSVTAATTSTAPGISTGSTSTSTSAEEDDSCPTDVETSMTVAPTPTTLATSTRSTPTSTSTENDSPTDVAAPEVKYLITFGDSYSQTGFDPSSTKPSAGNPLGNPPLPGWTASGGLNWVGFLASQFNTSTLLAYNFAYGGATTNATLVQPWQPTVLSFIDQVEQFSDSIASQPEYAPWTAQNSLFGVWMGVNDVGNSWWLAEYDELLERIMDSYFRQLQVMYDAGARRFVLLSVPPIHRTPAMLGESVEAQQGEAAAITKYNDAMATRLEAFMSQNDGVTAKVVDTAVPFNTALDNPTEYGSPDATCYNEDGTSCLWFNDYHPGVEINRLVAQAVADAWKGTFF